MGRRTFSCLVIYYIPRALDSCESSVTFITRYLGAANARRLRYHHPDTKVYILSLVLRE